MAQGVKGAIDRRAATRQLAAESAAGGASFRCTFVKTLAKP